MGTRGLGARRCPGARGWRRRSPTAREAPEVASPAEVGFA